MSKIRQILRLYSQGRSKLLIAQQTSVSRNTLKKYLKEFELSGLSFNEVNELGDKDLEDLFIKPEERPVTPKLQTLCSLFPERDWIKYLPAFMVQKENEPLNLPPPSEGRK